MCKMYLICQLLILSLTSVTYCDKILTDNELIHYTEPPIYVDNDVRSFTELSGEHLIGGQRIIVKSKSPYILREDIFVEDAGELVIEPGVEIRFAPMIGITVRGIITAKGEANAPITLTSIEKPIDKKESSTIRLVDGPNPLEGRLQLFHQGEWRSVCTNSRNWTRLDYETACRQLGFQGGRWYTWFDRQWPAKSRLLYENPQCRGTESKVEECQLWSARQLGAGVCDYHPDIGISCLPHHDGSSQAVKHWRGIRFENARFSTPLTQQNTLYIRQSESVLRHVKVINAGTGRDNNVTSAVHVKGVPPQMEWISILNSAYTGVNVTTSKAPVVMTNCTIRNNRGYGIYVNSSSGPTHIDNCVVFDNGADGIKYIHHDERPDEEPNRVDVYNLCTFPETSSQTLPITVFMEQSKYSYTLLTCPRAFYTIPGHVLTVEFLQMKTNKNDSATIEVYDQIISNDKLLARIDIRNGTLPQSVTSTQQQLHIKFIAQPQTQVLAFVRILSGYKKIYDLNVTGSAIANNNGRGIAAEKLRSLLHIHETSISGNNHVAGVHVLNGVPDVNITSSRISFNNGDGINITVTGGNRNISKTSISSNKGYGLSVWLNDSLSNDYKYFNQTTVVEYSEIFRNKDIGILIGNSTGISYVNITGNYFHNSSETAVQIQTSWKINQGLLKLQIGHNKFKNNSKHGIKIYPCLNINGKIEYNQFKNNIYGTILIRNPFNEEFNILPAYLLIQQNYFTQNSGTYVVNIGLSPYSDLQKILFTLNFLRSNDIKEPFLNKDSNTSILIPRSRVAAVLVVSSSNVYIYRNILNNPDSIYEVGSHLEDQSKEINCTYNYLGSQLEKIIYDKLFDRSDRYNLAKIQYLPYLLSNNHPTTDKIMRDSRFVPQFYEPGSNLIGGEVEGLDILPAGEYIVERDINIRPGGKLILQPGVTLKFPPAVGMMVAGKLEAKGKGLNNIVMTLKEEMPVELFNETATDEPTMFDEEMITTTIEPIDESKIPPVRLLGGRTHREGRLQVRLNDQWGTVCNYGWNIRAAALVCHQLGLTLDPDEWNLERSQIPSAGTNEDIILSNVQCTHDDFDITKCKAESKEHFENSCTHDNDVGVRCLDAAWAGVRLSPLADQIDLQSVTIEKAGLLDYATNSFKPALQIDFARHTMDSMKIINNLQDGLAIIYSDIYSESAINTVKNSEFSNNRGSGISFKQLGLKVINSRIENNHIAGIRHNPVLTAVEQREFAGWFLQKISPTIDTSYSPIFIPKHTTDIDLSNDDIKYLITEKIIDNVESIKRDINIICGREYIIGIQLLNPIENRSSEKIVIYDSPRKNINRNNWSVKRDLSSFPLTSTSFSIKLEYDSGLNAIGGAVLALSRVRAPIQNIRNRIVKGPIPTLILNKSKIKGNFRGIFGSFYNRYLDEVGDHYLRKSNESIRLINCELSHNKEEAIYINSPHWNIFESNITEISFHINNTLITDNGRGIVQFSRDMRHSNNLFHWIMQDNTIERNTIGGLDISLPYVWQYNENFTHSLYFGNNTWRDNNLFSFIIDGHYATLNISYNIFENNLCKDGLISIRGMEKKMKFNFNKIQKNNGNFMVEFKIDSQSEILGEIFAIFVYNEIKNNFKKFTTRNVYEIFNNPTYVVGFSGIQKVKIYRNLFGDNSLDYELVAGIKTAKIKNEVDVTENWWGTFNDTKIKEKIFDFDDWNNHAIANFRPFLTTDSFDSSISSSWEITPSIDLNNLGGRITNSLIIYHRSEPYIIKSDITIMPNASMTIGPGVVMEFAPNVGILVLGTLNAEGEYGQEIIMRPMKRDTTNLPTSISRRSVDNKDKETIRLCKEGKCSSSTNEGFIELFNRTTLQWTPLCDLRFTERNGQVACRQLGYDPLNVYVSHGRRYELHHGSLSRIWSWPEPLQCSGDEERLEDCQIRLNGQLYGHKYNCPWDGEYIFLHCGKRNLDSSHDYWGGIRITNSEFEHNFYEHRIHDVETHRTVKNKESTLKFIKISGAGILHNEKSPAIQSIMKNPLIYRVDIEKCAYHGINIISPTQTVQLLSNHITNVHGNGINILSLTGEGREADESSFTPLKNLNIPYNLFSLIDICDTTKEITIEERVVIYYKYDNHPENCVKIFRSTYRAKPFGFRLLQFNLFNTTGRPGRSDAITLYDGDIYNVSAKIIGHLEFNTPLEKKLFKTEGPSLSIRLFANGASGVHGFIAEVITLPISAIGFNRDVQHNISTSVIENCQEGAIKYSNAGEINAILTLEKNQFTNNCQKLYGNFSTCKEAISLDIQNTQLLYFRNNLIRYNQGGLSVRADSRGSATSLKGWINNNLFSDNINKPALYIEGRQSSPYQEVTIYRNYFIKNKALYDNNIVLKQVVSNMTLNYLHANIGLHLLEISGFERVRLPIYQSTSHNGFYNNYAVDRYGRSTIIAGTPGQQYVDNIFFNPDNDYEIITVNRSMQMKISGSHIDAVKNWWGYNDTLAVSARIRDHCDSSELIEVKFKPIHNTNKTILNGKCPPSWDLVGDTCYIYIGAPMNFHSARDFCKSANASMPFIMSRHYDVWKFLRNQQERFDYFDHVWVQQLENIDKCTSFGNFDTISVSNCNDLNPFICEIDPRIHINPLSWKQDVVAISVLSAMAVAFVFLAAVIGFWISKSKRRKVERLERRNSIRQSLHSLRSVGSTTGFTELAYRRKPIATKSTDTLTSRSLDYKKMMESNGGSIDSMDKSQLNSSIEDNQSYDVYEAHNPRYSPSTSDFKGQQKYAIPHVDNPVFDLTYRNNGFHTHSTFTSRTNSNWPSVANSELSPDEIPVEPIDESGYINNTSTLPLNSSLATTDSITELKRDIETTPTYSSIDYGVPMEYRDDGLPTTPASEPLPMYFNPPIPRQTYYYDERPKSTNLLETNLDTGEEKPLRSKSETLLETNFDVFLPNEPTERTHLSAESRSKSQPLETAM